MLLSRTAPYLAALPLFVVSLGLVPPAGAHRPTPGAAGSLVAVTVEVDGTATPLYAAPDGSRRFYLEAKPHRPYAVRLANRTGQRVGVVLTIDGLNAISGERDTAGPGRMYVLDPWGSAYVQGWRTSLRDVRRFTFVDEKSSYSARAGKANEKMGWIEVAVHREIGRPHVSDVVPRYGESDTQEERSRDDRAEAGAAPAPRAQGKADGDAAKRAPSTAGRYPGTGWGDRREDRVEVVQFEPEAHAADRVTLRYEYRSGLYALGVLPRPVHRDRLRERDSAEGFAKPPLY
jgi:hypothetical protein